MLEAFVPLDPDPDHPYSVGIVVTGLRRQLDSPDHRGECEVDSRYVCSFASRIVGGLPYCTFDRPFTGTRGSSHERR
eukprot:15463963-Alexandrium_andersonii.AAC.1